MLLNHMGLKAAFSYILFELRAIDSDLFSYSWGHRIGDELYIGLRCCITWAASLVRSSDGGLETKPPTNRRKHKKQTRLAAAVRTENAPDDGRCEGEW